MFSPQSARQSHRDHLHSHNNNNNSHSHNNNNNAHKRNQSITFADLDYDDRIKTIARRKQGQVQVILGKYQLKEKVGKGAFGIVYKGFEFETGRYVAIKRLKKEGIDEKALYNLKLEIELLRNLDHPNIVQYLGLMDSDNHVNMILEFIDSGSLLQVIQKFGVLPEHLSAIYTGQVLEGLQYLHAMNVIHRDIKASNILITAEGVIKLADFGIATTGEQGTDQSADTSSFAEGSPFWMAPEVIQLEPPTTACDIWSLGCTIIELITGVPPYFDMPAMSALFRIVQESNPPIPNNISPELRRFLKDCFIPDPKERPSAAELSNHPWINSGLGNSGDQNGPVELPTNNMTRSADDLGNFNSTGKGGNESGGSSGSGRGSLRSRGTITSIDWGGGSGSDTSDRDSTGVDWESFSKKNSKSSMRVKDVAQSFEEFNFKEAVGYVVLITGYETRKNKLFSYTVFRLRVCFGKESWRIFKTYTDFKDLHLQVTLWLRQQKSKNKQLGQVKLPKLPGTKVFGADKGNFVKKRKHQLQDYINTLIGISEVMKAGFITNFLKTDGKDALSRDHGSESADDDEASLSHSAPGGLISSMTLATASATTLSFSSTLASSPSHTISSSSSSNLVPNSPTSARRANSVRNKSASRVRPLAADIAIDLSSEWTIDEPTTTNGSEDLRASLPE